MYLTNKQAERAFTVQQEQGPEVNAPPASASLTPHVARRWGPGKVCSRFEDTASGKGLHAKLKTLSAKLAGGGNPKPPAHLPDKDAATLQQRARCRPPGAAVADVLNHHEAQHQQQLKALDNVLQGACVRVWVSGIKAGKAKPEQSNCNPAVCVTP